MTTVNDALTDYLDSLAVRSKDTTVRTTASHVKKLRHHCGRWAVSEMTPLYINTVVNGLRHDDGISDTTINGVLRVLRASLRLAEENGRIERAPKVRLLKETRKIPSILTAAELESVLQSAPTIRSRLALMFGAYAGLRHREILHLTYGDIDAPNLMGGEVRVTAKNGWTPKTHQERAVPLADPLRRAMLDWYSRVDGEEKVLRYPLFNQSTMEDCGRAFERAGINDPDRKPGLHMLRRTWASRLLANGVDIETVRELGGWADLKTVQRYLSSTDDLKRAAVETLE